MRDAILSFLSTKDSGKFFSLNSLIASERNPQTREATAEVRRELMALVNAGEIEIDNNAHLRLDAIDPTNYADDAGNAMPRRYFDISTVRISARGKGSRTPSLFVAPPPSGKPVIPQRTIPEFKDEQRATRGDYKGGISALDKVNEPAPAAATELTAEPAPLNGTDIPQ